MTDSGVREGSEAPVVVIGAGRSGTNLLRDFICTFPGYVTWPCDEINYVWRHGNRSAPTDEFTPSRAEADVQTFIRRAFDKQARRAGGGTVVEKTCANSLRVGFVHEVFPDARFVFIVRDGRDVVASAIDRWTASVDLAYIARKARFVPPSDLPYYAGRYAMARLSRLRSAERRLSSWGPRFDGMDDVLAEASLPEVCAHQWQRCVESSVAQLDRFVDDSRVLRLRYEDLVTDPVAVAARLGAFLGGDVPSVSALPGVSATSIGRWRTVLSDSDQDAVQRVLADTLARQGYDV